MEVLSGFVRGRLLNSQGLLNWHVVDGEENELKPKVLIMVGRKAEVEARAQLSPK